MSGTIVVDRIESDASYASSINIASPLVVANTVSFSQPVTVSNTFVVPAGSASAPAITPTGDTNTGIYFPAADTIAFAEGGVESARFDSNGNFGIGTTTPISGSVLDVVSSGSTYPRIRSSAGSAASLFFQNSDTGTTTGDGTYIGISSAEEGLFWNTENTAIRIATNNTERVRVAANGYVGIGTTNPVTQFHVYGEAALTGTTGGARGVSFAYDGGTSCPLYFGGEQDSAQKSIYLSGYWMNIRGHSNEGIRFVFSQSAGVAPRSDVYQFQYNSATRPTGSTTWDGFSDIRAKENIRDMENALNIVENLRPIRYDWTDDYADAVNMFNLDKSDPKPYKWISVKENGYDTLRKNNQYGFIAQEFEEVFPHDVSQTKITLGNEEINDFKTVNFDSLIPVLTKAIQELKAELDAAKARIEALESQ